MDDWPSLRIFATCGRRRVTLILFGTLWVAVGLGVLTGTEPRFTPREDTSFLSIMNSPLWGLLWLTCAVVAVIAGILRVRYKFFDEWGFNALLIPPLTWTLAFMWSEISWLITGGIIGRDRGWIGSIVYLVICLAILVIAGWPDPADEVTKGEIQ